MGTRGTTMEFFNLKQKRGANKYPQYTAVYSEYTAVYSRVYSRILRYWSLEYTAVYPKRPKWGIFKHNIDHHNWQTRGIPQPTYACIVHYTFVPTCTCHIPLSPKTPFFTRILPGIPGMPGYAHHKEQCEIRHLCRAAPADGRPSGLGKYRGVVRETVVERGVPTQEAHEMIVRLEMKTGNPGRTCDGVQLFYTRFMDLEAQIVVGFRFTRT